MTSHDHKHTYGEGQGHAHHDHEGHNHASGGHSHRGGGHHHAPASFGRAFAIGIILNVSYVAAEALYGVTSQSLALVADAGHNLGDVLGLATAWVAAIVSKAAPTNRFTYGLRSSSILAALSNAMVLLIVTGAVTWEAIRRLIEPQPVAGATVMVVAAVGVLVNGVTAFLFMAGRKGDLNIRGAFLHMASDALVSVGVVVAGGLILLTGRLWLDPVISIVISVVIVRGTWSLFRESVGLALHAVPAGIDAAKVERYLTGLPGISEVHDLHIWGMSTTENALTAHLVKPDGPADDKLIHEICDQLKRHFAIGHSTLQFESGSEAHPCALAEEGTV
jgi:cobalt-zinc-cadmium efflux system protein